VQLATVQTIGLGIQAPLLTMKLAAQVVQTLSVVAQAAQLATVQTIGLGIQAPLLTMKLAAQLVQTLSVVAQAAQLATLQTIGLLMQAPLLTMKLAAQVVQTLLVFAQSTQLATLQIGFSTQIVELSARVTTLNPSSQVEHLSEAEQNLQSSMSHMKQAVLAALVLSRGLRHCSHLSVKSQWSHPLKQSTHSVPAKFTLSPTRHSEWAYT
jgi:hypothetical protein